MAEGNETSDAVQVVAACFANLSLASDISGDNHNKSENNSMKESDGSDDQGQCSSEMSFCDICMEAKAKSETRRSTSKCSHIYCSECITKYIEAKIQEKISMITCPESTCKETLEPYLCRDIISGPVLDRWENALCESSVLASHKIYCPFKDCSVLLVNDDDGVILRSTECPHCNRLFCAQCEVPWHSDLTCDDFQEIKKGGKDDILVISLAKDQKWTRCPSCRFYVEKVQGCAHITCRCSHQFCYLCGNPWTLCNGGCQTV